MLSWGARFNLMNQFRLDGIQKGVEQQRNLLYAAAARRLEVEQSKMIEGKSDDEPERE